MKTIFKKLEKRFYVFLFRKLMEYNHKPSVRVIKPEEEQPQEEEALVKGYARSDK